VLAGTTARGETEALDLAISTELKNSHKNLSEHALALESVTAALKPLTTGVDFDETPFAVKLPNLWHLASDVHAVIAPGVTGLDLVAALHPTAAVAGTPRQIALKVIEELEPFDRGRYAGPVGWISSSGDCEWAIALRGGQISGNKVTAYAGCGLVAESDPEHELAETNLKFRPIREALR
jgi:menaquinone-specific isochorismate synthase